MDWHGLWNFLNNYGIWLALLLLWAIQEIVRAIVKMHGKSQDARIKEAESKVRTAELELEKERERRRPKYYTVDDVPTHREEKQYEGYQGLPPQV